MRNTLVVLSVLWAVACSAPVPLCESSSECSGVTKCINGTCQDPSGCIAESPANYCLRLSKTCGPVAAEDNCGGARVEECGSCTAPLMCIVGQCAQCVPESDAALCSRLSLECGPTSATDNCGALRTLNCGNCESSKLCGGGGQPNLCGALCARERG